MADKPNTRDSKAIDLLLSVGFAAILAKVSLTAALILVGVVAAIGAAYLLFRRRRSVQDAGRALRSLRYRRVSLLSIVALLGIAAAAAYLWGARGHQGPDPAARAALLALVSPEMRSSCRDSDIGSDERRVVARLQCADRDAGVQVRYSLYSTRADLDNAFKGRINEVGLPRGDCFRETSAVGVYRTPTTPQAGEILCFTDGTSETLEWTDFALRVYAAATRTALSGGPSVLAWWSDTGTVSRENSRRAFPDEAESRLLRHVPQSFADTCERSDFTKKGSRASIYCKPKSGADTVWYLSFYNAKDLQAIVAENRQTYRGVPGSCSRDGSAAASATWSLGEENEGYRFCYRDRDDDDAWIEWSHGDLKIYAYATRKGGLFDLYEWWLRDSGPDETQD